MPRRRTDEVSQIPCALASRRAPAMSGLACFSPLFAWLEAGHGRMPRLCCAGARAAPLVAVTTGLAPCAQPFESRGRRRLMEHEQKVDLMRRNLLLGSAALGAATWIPPVFAASGGIAATIDTGAVRPPISPMI